MIVLLVVLASVVQVSALNDDDKKDMDLEGVVNRFDELVNRLTNDVDGKVKDSRGRPSCALVDSLCEKCEYDGKFRQQCQRDCDSCETDQSDENICSSVYEPCRSCKIDASYRNQCLRKCYWCKKNEEACSINPCFLCKINTNYRRKCSTKCDLCEGGQSGGWSAFTTYGRCSKSCGGGTQKRSRTCNTRTSRCQGNAVETRICNTHVCPVNGQWGEWKFEECTKSCGGGQQFKERKCNNPAPSNGGKPCPISSEKAPLPVMRQCNLQTCPEYSCEFETGDGTGLDTTESDLGELKGLACIGACLALKGKNKNVNGVTMFADATPGCWCEIGMKSVSKTATSYMTCFLKERAPTPKLEYHCVLSSGDGTGLNEVKISNDTKGLDCIDECIKWKRYDNRINGVTVQSDNTGGCWCEREMTSVSSSSTFKTCFLKKSDCGKQRLPLTRIVGGVDVDKPGRWPWHVALTYSSGYNFCGGTLIKPNVVLTAAHCVSTNGKYRVRVGDYNRNKKDDTEQVVAVRKVIKHEAYKKQSVMNDIALLFLSSPVNLEGVVNVACLPKKLYDMKNIKGKCFVTGWGQLKENGGRPDILQEVELPIVSQEECSKSYSKIFGGKICAGYKKGGKDSCQGDSGGPLVCDRGDDTYEVRGVVSYGIGCARQNYYGVYARVFFYNKWIKDKLQQESLSDSIKALELLEEEIQKDILS